MRQRLHAQLSLAGGGIIQHEDRATALHEELGLARARRTFDEIETAAREPPSEHVIQPGNPGCGAVDGGCARGVVPRLAVKLSVHLCCPVAAYFGSNGDNLARTVPVIR